MHSIYSRSVLEVFCKCLTSKCSYCGFSVFFQLLLRRFLQKMKVRFSEKKKYLIMIYFYFFLIIAVCPQNEEYKDCAVGLCLNTCEKPNIAIMCKAPCFAGCGCIKDYLRNTKGVCVPPRKCGNLFSIYWVIL